MNLKMNVNVIGLEFLLEMSAKETTTKLREHPGPHSSTLGNILSSTGLTFPITGLITCFNSNLARKDYRNQGSCNAADLTPTLIYQTRPLDWIQRPCPTLLNPI